jgi:CubicO group peptidase (beta-lactamase class C family)
VEALGTLAVGGSPVERTSLFRIASTTKPITAAATVVLDGPWAGATGWDGGLGTSFLLHPARDLVVIVLTQRLFEAAKGPALHRELQAAALAAAD